MLENSCQHMCCLIKLDIPYLMYYMSLQAEIAGIHAILLSKGLIWMTDGKRNGNSIARNGVRDITDINEE